MKVTKEHGKVILEMTPTEAPLVLNALRLAAVLGLAATTVARQTYQKAVALWEEMS